MNGILHSDNAFFSEDSNDLSIKAGKWICENHRTYDIQHIRGNDYKNLTLSIPIVLQAAAVHFGYAPTYVAELIRTTLPTSNSSVVSESHYRL